MNGQRCDKSAEKSCPHSPTALLSMMSWALVLAAMMVFGLAGRAPVKMERRKLMVGDGVVCVREEVV